jgi:hypothetical protein
MGISTPLPMGYWPPYPLKRLSKPILRKISDSWKIKIFKKVQNFKKFIEFKNKIKIKIENFSKKFQFQYFKNFKNYIKLQN